MTDLAFSFRGAGTCNVLSTRGMEWTDENVVTESWQWMGNSFAIEPRFIPDVLMAARLDGLKCEYDGEFSEVQQNLAEGQVK